MAKKNDLHLVYVNPIGINSKGLNEYELFFSETPDTTWAGDWNIECPSACSDLIPEETMYSVVKRIETNIPLKCAQENSCFSMADVQDGILALLFENISGYETYPEPYRIVLHYGEDMNKVIELLEGRDVELS